MSSEIDGLKIYEFVRDEIKREDKNTHDRISSALAFQGILMAAMVFLISSSWSNTAVGISKSEADFLTHLNAIRVIILLLVGLVGFVIAIASYAGVDAAQKSLNDTIDNWEMQRKEFLDQSNFNKLPSAYAESRIHNQGKGFPFWINQSFMGFWIVYLVTITTFLRCELIGLIT